MLINCQELEKQASKEACFLFTVRSFVLTSIGVGTADTFFAFLF